LSSHKILHPTLNVEADGVVFNGMMFVSSITINVS
jgi:hypothetical protein